MSEPAERTCRWISRLVSVNDYRDITLQLSTAERRVLELLCEGLTNPQIADRLYLSRRTVQSHLYNIFKKLGVSSRTELVALAVRSGIED